MWRFFWQNIRFSYRSHLIIISGVALATAVVIGALIIGNSVRSGLVNGVSESIGNTRIAVKSGDRFFDRTLSSRLSAALNVPVAPVLQMRGSVRNLQKQAEIPKCNVYAVDSTFKYISAEPILWPSDHGVLISENISTKLNVLVGDLIQLSFERATNLPVNTPFVAGSEQTITINVTVQAILTDKFPEKFNLANSQLQSYNVFVSTDLTDRFLKPEKPANIALITSESVNREDVDNELCKIMLPSDVGLLLSQRGHSGTVIHSNRVFIDSTLPERLRADEKKLSYFANSFSNKGDTAWYGFVSSLPDSACGSSQTIINQWLAEKLNLTVGDSLRLGYYVIGPYKKLEERTASFVVKSVVEMDDPIENKDLMPHIPGLTDVGNCRDWRTGVPIELNRIEKADEIYWKQYKGTPKAFINNKTANLLWSNRFGSYTSLVFNADSAAVGKMLEGRLRPDWFGISVENIREKRLFAATHGVDFSQLFLGLSFFLILSAIILSVLLLRRYVEKRKTSDAVLSALGFSNKQIIFLFMTEIMLVVFIGTLFGVLLALGFAKIVLWSMNHFWTSIVGTTIASVKPDLVSVLSGIGFVSITIGTLALLYLLKSSAIAVHNRIRRVIYSNGQKYQKRGRWYFVLLVVACLIVVYFWFTGRTGSVAIVFFVGTLFLISACGMLKHPKRNSQKELGINSVMDLLAFNQRSAKLGSFLLFALGSFLTFIVGLNHKSVSDDYTLRSSSTGGFAFWAETSKTIISVPETYLKPAMFIRKDGDDASCLNINGILQPALLGVPVEMLQKRFTISGNKTWFDLKKRKDSTVFPAFADATVLQWSLYKHIGDTLFYTSENGVKIGFEIIGTINNSIFQGYLLVDREMLQNLYPSLSGANIMLFDALPEQKDMVRHNIERLFAGYGLELISTTQKLEQFLSVENSYLSVFIVLGFWALLFGTVGFGVFIVNDIRSGLWQFQQLKTLGYALRHIKTALFRTYFYLLLKALFGGVCSAILALSVQQHFVIADSLFAIVLILVIGLFGGVVIYLVSSKMLHKSFNLTTYNENRF